MAESVVIVGIGEMGGVFAHGLLRCGRTVHPVTRATDPLAVAREVPEPEVVLVAVAEADLHPVLDRVPQAWQDRLALLQNELLPDDWKRHDLPAPTVAVVWFEKKKGQPTRVVLPTRLAGPHAPILIDALEALDIPARPVEGELLHEMVTKNLYILTTNIAGLEVGGTVSELWSRHRDLASDVVTEVVALQAWRAGVTLPQHELIERMVAAFDGDPDHRCTGRSAPTRLARALDQAREAGLQLPTLERIAARHL